ncbi:MAG: DUF1579 family protein [Planctomycetota bacterium]
MTFRRVVSYAFAVGLFSSTCVAESATTEPAELTVLKAAVGVWDAEIETWPAGLDKPSIKFEGIETNRAYGEHWIVSDFDSEFEGQQVKVHSIVGYDLDRKKLVGTVVDAGPYAATMTGDYDAESNSVQWVTNIKYPDGTPGAQRTTVTQKTPDERILVLMVPGKKQGEFVKCMEIKFTRRK